MLTEIKAIDIHILNMNSFIAQRFHKKNFVCLKITLDMFVGYNVAVVCFTRRPCLQKDSSTVG